MRAVLDTNIVLYQLGDRLPDGLPAGEYFISVITEIELLSFSPMAAAEEKRIKAHLSDVEIVAQTREITDRTISLRRANRLKLPDAIIAATALVLDAELFTNDAELGRVAGLRCRAVASSA